jgi:hypothetical protein
MFGDSYVGVTSPAHWNTLDQNWDLLTAFKPGPGIDPVSTQAICLTDCL